MRMDIGRTYTTQYRREEKAGKTNFKSITYLVSTFASGHCQPNGRLKQTEQTFSTSTRDLTLLFSHLDSVIFE